MTKKNLLVEIEPGSGFCFGVVNAIKLAEENLQNNKKLYCIGQIVHNETEVERLENIGLVTIEHNRIPEIHDDIILVRAHGEPPETFLLAKKNNNRVIDATCPIVLKLQNRIKKSFENGENIVIFGKPEHPEVIGLNGQTGNNAIIVSDTDTFMKQNCPQKFTLYSQTTMPLDKFDELVLFIKAKGYDVVVNDTICRQVSGRKDKLIAFCSNFDKVIFVAGRNSSNGKVLYKICKSVNQNSFFISSTEEIDDTWFVDNERVGICGATSTPKWQLENVKNFIQQL